MAFLPFTRLDPSVRTFVSGYYTTFSPWAFYRLPTYYLHSLPPGRFPQQELLGQTSVDFETGCIKDLLLQALPFAVVSEGAFHCVTRSFHSSNCSGRKRPSKSVLGGYLFLSRYLVVRQEKDVSYSGCESRQLRSSQPSVASLGRCRVTCVSKRRQQTNRPEAQAEAIEPRNT